MNSCKFGSHTHSYRILRPIRMLSKFNQLLWMWMLLIPNRITWPYKFSVFISITQQIVMRMSRIFSHLIALDAYRLFIELLHHHFIELTSLWLNKFIRPILFHLTWLFFSLMYSMWSFSFGLWQLWAVDDYFFLNLSISVSTHSCNVRHKYAYKYQQHAFCSDAQLNHFFSLEHSSEHGNLTMIRSRFAIRHVIYIYVEKRHTDKHDRLFTSRKLTSHSSHQCNKWVGRRQPHTFWQIVRFALTSLRLWHIRVQSATFEIHTCVHKSGLRWSRSNERAQ